MKIRLIKPTASPPKEMGEPTSDEVQLITTIRSWIREFKSSKANQAGLDLRQINPPQER
jgi:hypothetical protein